MRIATFDIEATKLDASYGRMLSYAFKFLDEDEVRSDYITHFSEEKELLEGLVENWDEADIVVTWYGRKYDIPFVNARLMINGMLPLSSKKHIDLYQRSKTLRTLGNRLDNVAKDFDFHYQKYDVPASAWLRATEGDQESIDEIVYHNEIDVLMTEEALEVFRPTIGNIVK